MIKILRYPKFEGDKDEPISRGEFNEYVAVDGRTHLAIGSLLALAALLEIILGISLVV